MEYITIIAILLFLFLCILLFIFINQNYEYKKNINNFYENFNRTLKNIDIPIYFEIENNFFTNIEDKLLEKLKSNINENHFAYKTFNIVGKKESFYLEKNKENNNNITIKKQNIEIEELQQQLRLIKDRNYYFYKEFINKLTFLLKEVDDVHTQYTISKGIVSKYDIENLKSKLEFLIKFFKENGGAEYHRYRLHNIEEFTEELKKRFLNDIEILVDMEKKLFYIEMEKVELVIETILYSLLKSRVIREKIILDIKLNEEKVDFKISTKNSGLPLNKIIDEEFMELLNFENNIWQLKVFKNEIILSVIVKIIEDYKNTEEIKTIILESNFSTIREVEKNILYDMENKGFNDDEIRDMKLIIDEIVINAIEHGNKFDTNKKVIITYKFTDNENAIEFEVEDEGKGFETNDIDFEQLKEPETYGERGRGIYIIKNLADDMKYFNNGTKVYVKKIKK